MCWTQDNTTVVARQYSYRHPILVLCSVVLISPGRSLRGLRSDNPKSDQQTNKISGLHPLCLCSSSNVPPACSSRMNPTVAKVFKDTLQLSKKAKVFHSFHQLLTACQRFQIVTLAESEHHRSQSNCMTTRWYCAVSRRCLSLSDLSVYRADETVQQQQP